MRGGYKELTAAEAFGLLRGALYTAPDIEKLDEAMRKLNGLHETRASLELPPPSKEEELALCKARKACGAFSRHRAIASGAMYHGPASISCKAEADCKRARARGEPAQSISGA